MEGQVKFATYKKTPSEKKRYTVSYVDWLDNGETVASVMYAIDNDTVPPLMIEASAVQPDGMGVTFFVSGGINDEQYQLNILMETNVGQRKEDWMTFVVEEP
jgi:hypothetical protein